MKSLVFLLLLALVSLPDSSAVTHTLKYFYTGSSGVPNFPEFVAFGMVDDLQIDHYDSITGKMQFKQEWMKEVTADDPQFLDRNTGNYMGTQQWFKVNIEIAKERFNQTGGVHMFQWMYGCEWDDESPEKNGFFQFGYDGADFISLKPKEGIWVAAKRQAEITKQKWDKDETEIERLKSYLNQECIEWLQKHVNYGKSSLMRTELPSVSLLQKTPSSPVSCHATGFYPDRATLSWRKGEEELHEDVDHGEMLLNPDGTFQMSVDLKVSSVPPEDWSSYKCVFQLSGAKEITTTLDKNQIRTNWGKPVSSSNHPGAAVIIVILVVLLLPVGVAIRFCIRTRNNPAFSGDPSQQAASHMLNNNNHL